MTKLERDFVLVTVDGTSLASDERIATLRAIGASIRELDTTLVIGSVGIGLREKAVAASGLADERVINGVLKSGIGNCPVISPGEFGTQSRGTMLVFITSQILDWSYAEELYADPLWPVTVDAVRAIQGLVEYGDAGKATAAALMAERLAGIWNYPTVAALPLDWMGFNAFHHRQNVNSSDIQLLRSCIERGDAEQRDMSSVRQIIAAWEARQDITRTSSCL